jgi:catechol 2,3-dioxygenase-like lactoylglutathione lyase family enzyme
MVEDTKVAARFSVQDLQRAKAFYAEKLGLQPSEERPGGLLYRCGEGVRALRVGGKSRGIRDVSLMVNEDEVFGLLGPDDAGKMLHGAARGFPT